MSRSIWSNTFVRLIPGVLGLTTSCKTQRGVKIQDFKIQGSRHEIVRGDLVLHSGGQITGIYACAAPRPAAT